MGTTIESTLENIPLREWPLDTAFVALFWILGPKQTKTRQNKGTFIIKT